MKKLFWIFAIAALGFFAYRFLSDEGYLTPGAADDNKEAIGSLSVAGRREYSSIEFGFSFSYPSSWILKEAGSGIVILKPNADMSDDEAPVSIDASGDMPYEKSAAEMRQNVLGSDKKEFSIGGVRGVRLAGNLKPELGEPPETFFIFTMLDRAGRLFSADYRESRPSDESSRAVYNAVVESLQFR